MWNPVIFVDLNGEDSWSVDENGYVQRTGDDGGVKKQTVIYANGETSVFVGDYYHEIISDLCIEKVIPDDTKHKLSSHNGDVRQGTAMANVFYDLATNTNVEWRLDYTKDNRIIISSNHDISYSPSAASLGLSLDNLHSTIHSHPGAEDNYTKEIESMGMIWNKGAFGGDYGLRNKQPKDLNSYVFMKNSHRAWQLRPHNNPIIIGNTRGEVHFSCGSQILQLLKH